NARDALLHGGEIVVTADEETIDPDRPGLPAGRYLRLSVRDTGRGMPPDVLARALEPFFTTKGRERGSGLGLSMVYGFARQSGGGLEIESAPGAGTEVRLYLPVAQPDPDAAAAHAPVAAPGRGRGQ